MPCLIFHGSLSVAVAQFVRPVRGGAPVPRRAVGTQLAGSLVLLVGLASAGLCELPACALLVAAAAALLPSTHRASSVGSPGLPRTSSRSSSSLDCLPRTPARRPGPYAVLGASNSRYASALAPRSYDALIGRPRAAR